MSLIILHGSRLPVVRIARIAGQYAKPRSKPTEVVEFRTKDGKTEKKEVMSFRGDNVNGYDPTDRAPDPQRLLGCVVFSPRNVLPLLTMVMVFFVADLISTPPRRSTTSVHCFHRALPIYIIQSTGRFPMSGRQSFSKPSPRSLRVCKIVWSL